VPADVTNAIAIAAGLDHSLALRDNGQVVGWGWGSLGETNFPPDLTNAVAISAGGYFSIVLRADKTVFATGRISTNILPTLTNIVGIACGYGHVLVLRNDGKVTAWGMNDSGQTNVPQGLSNVVAIAAGAGHSLALKNDGTMVGWGASGQGQTFNFGQASTPPGLSNAVQLVAGWDHSMALMGDVLGPLQSPQLFSPVLFANSFGVCTPTAMGWNYRLDYRGALTDNTWMMLPPMPGNGGVRTLSDKSPSDTQRFYRVRVYR